MKIITLTLNPAIDVHCSVDSLKIFSENRAVITDRDAGGKGINISRALLSVGCENTAIVVVGEQNGGDFLRSLEKDALNFKAIMTPGTIRENITVHQNDGETRLSFEGFKANDKAASEVKNALLSLCECDDILAVAGSFPQNFDFESFKELLISLRNKGVKIIIDSKNFSLEDLKSVKPWLIKPNREEISHYLKREIEDFSDVKTAARELCLCGIENVMVSLGEKGAMLVNAKGIFEAVAPKINALSTIGAGDSSIAGFAYAQKMGFCSKDKLRYAVAFGSAACLESGTRPPLKENIEKLFEQITVM